MKKALSSKLISKIPNILSFSRILTAPAIVVLLNLQKIHIAYGLFLISALSDFLDGHIARKLNAVNSWGWFIDSSADFILIGVLLGHFCSIGYVSVFLVLLIITSFITFVITGVFNKYPYDTYGKYIGVFCYICIGIMMAFPVLIVGQICDWGLKIYLMYSLFNKVRGWIQMPKGKFGSVTKKQANNSCIEGV